MKRIINAMVLNAAIEDFSEVAKNFQGWFWPLIVSGIGWTFILEQVLFTYRNVESWVHISLAIIYAFLYANFFILATAFLSALFFIGKIGVKKGFYIGVHGNLPIVPIALISLMMKIQFGQVKILGYFPEHALIIGGYLTFRRRSPLLIL